jgi:hypothetical protein
LSMDSVYGVAICKHIKLCLNYHSPNNDHA